jgi:hypothetical protein
LKLSWSRGPEYPPPTCGVRIGTSLSVQPCQSVNRRPNDVIWRQSTQAEPRDLAGAAMMLAPLVASSVIRKAPRPILATASDPQAAHLPWESNSISARQLTQHHCFFIGSPQTCGPPNLRAPKIYALGLPLKRAERRPNSLASNHDLSIHDLHRAPEQAASPAAVQAAPYLRGVFLWVSLGFDNDTLAVLELRHKLAQARPFRSASGPFRSAPGPFRSVPWLLSGWHSRLKGAMTRPALSWEAVFPGSACSVSDRQACGKCGTYSCSVVMCRFNQ